MSSIAFGLLDRAPRTAPGRRGSRSRTRGRGVRTARSTVRAAAGVPAAGRGRRAARPSWRRAAPRRRLVEAGLRGDAQRHVQRASPAGRRAGRRRTRSSPRARARTARSRRAGRSRRCHTARPGGRPGAVVRMPWSQIAPWARISTAPGWRSASSTRPSASGGRPRPAWIRIGTPPRLRPERTRRPSRAVEHEVLRARMQLDPARARRQAAFALGERVFGGVQATEGDQPARRSRPPTPARGRWARCRRGGARGRAAGTRTRGARRRRRAGRAAARRQRASVLVQAEVGVRVDHFGVGRAQAAGDLVPGMARARSA